MSGEMVPAGPDDFLFYESSDGRSRIEVRIKGETVWLSVAQMTDLFGRDKSVISRHIANIFDEGELVPGAVVADFATTAADGKTYQVRYYNLDVIISLTDREILTHAGKISREQALAKADAEFETFRRSQVRLSEPVDQHFDEAVDEVKKLAKAKPPVKSPKGKKKEGEQ